MQCSNCNKSSSVVVGSKHYCSNCGELMRASNKAIDFVPVAAVRSAPKPAPRPVRPAAVAAPKLSTRSAMDIGKRRSDGGILDLRGTSAKPVRHTAVAASNIHNRAKPTVAPAAKPVVPAAAKHTSLHAKKLHEPVKAIVDAPPTAVAVSRQHHLRQRLEQAATVERSQAIGRFNTPKSAAVAAEPAPVRHAEAPMQLPEHAAAQHEHLSRLLQAARASTPEPPRRPARRSYATMAAAVAVMAGYIWVHNYPHMALSSASDKAGFMATLPNFTPSSYSLAGSVDYAPGLVTLNFKSPSFSTPLRVTQQPTAWDSSSLLDNFVATKSDSYTAVNGQGLTIYVFDNNQKAAWINHGIWYTVEGAAHLGRDQLLKLAYSF